MQNIICITKWDKHVRAYSSMPQNELPVDKQRNKLKNPTSKAHGGGGVLAKDFSLMNDVGNFADKYIVIIY